MKQSVMNKLDKGTINVDMFDQDICQQWEDQDINEGQTEKRIDIRKPCVMLVDFAIHGRVYRSVGKNISEGGLFIAHRPALIPRLALKMSIMFPDQAPLEVSGEIVWKSMKGLGVRFKMEEPELREHIKDYIQKTANN